jgi:hypothetical protein
MSSLEEHLITLPITRPSDVIVDLSHPLDKSKSTDEPPYPVYWKSKKDHPNTCCVLLCCALSIASTSLTICATFGLFN